MIRSSSKALSPPIPDFVMPASPATTFTVFTPTYNRAHTLERVYASLCAQTFADFEWLIVDDGSTDGTSAIVRAWQEQAKFTIRYLFQENQGKHVAFNKGVREALGAFFVPLDSDDACVPRALERLLHHWESIPPADRSKFAGVTCRCMDQNGRLVGDPFPFETLDSDPREIYYRYGITGELWGAGRIEVMREFALDETAKRTYIPEGTLWFLIARSYKARYVSEALRIYYLEGASITRHQLPSRNALGAKLENLTRLRDDLSYFRFAPLRFVRFGAWYSRFSFHLGQGVMKQVQDLPNAGSAFLYTVGLPFGVLMYARDRFLERNAKSVRQELQAK